MRRGVSTVHTEPAMQKKNTEDLDDNDAVASFGDVQTAGILLAQRYIRTSLIRLIICLLSTILFAAGTGDAI